MYKPFKKILPLGLSFCLLSGISHIPAQAADTKIVPDKTWYTTDTSLSEYTITTLAELAGFKQLVDNDNVGFKDKTVKLAADLDFAGYDVDTNPSNGNWVPICPTFSTLFWGTFDGQNHTISNMTVKGTYSLVGLFGRAGTVQNLGLINVDISTSIGTWASGTTAVGGVVGEATDVKNCFTTGKISATVKATMAQTEVGGIVGILDRSLENCFSSASINSDTAVNSFADTSIGGLIGRSDSTLEAYIKNSYCTGDITTKGTAKVGGMAGGITVLSLKFMDVDNCYSSGMISTDSNAVVGGFTGKAFGTVNPPKVKNCMFDKDNAGTDKGLGDGSAIGEITSLTTDQMLDENVLTNQHFDSAIWMKRPIEGGGDKKYYPELRCFGETGTSAVQALSKTGALVREKYELTVTDGTIASGISSKKILMDTNVTVTANTAPEGKVFDKWEATGVALTDDSKSSVTFVMPNNTVALTATYKTAPSFEIIVENDGNGTASVDTSPAKQGSTVTVMTEPKKGYHFKSLQAVSPSDLSISGNSFIMPSKEVSVKVIFEIDPLVISEIIVENDGNGTASVDKTPAKEGSTVTMMAVPNKGYHFKSYKAVSPSDLSISGNSFIMPSVKVTVKAIFEIDTPAVVPAPTENNTSAPSTPSTPSDSSTSSTSSTSSDSGNSNTSSTTVPDTKTITVVEAPNGIPNTEQLSAESVGNAFDQSVEVRLKDDTATETTIRTALESTLSQENAKITVIFPLDISLYIKGTDTKVQPNEGAAVKITCPIPTALLDQKEKLLVVCMIDGKLNVLSTTRITMNGVPCIQFTATHFSPYALVVDMDGKLTDIAAGASVADNATLISIASIPDLPDTLV